MKKQPGWQLMAPGLYRDQDGAAHISPREILAFYKIPYTQENYNMIVETMEEAMRLASKCEPKITFVPEE